jgi:glutamine synthetase
MTASLSEQSVGKVGFVQRHGLWTDEDREAADRIRAQLAEADLRQVRIAWCDQHGIARGKTLSVRDFVTVLDNGMDFQTATLVMDTTNNIFVPLFVPGGGFGVPELSGYPDAILVPDPKTFVLLPWADRTGWVLSDMYFGNGKPVPFSTRHILRTRLEALAAAGYEYVAGLEVEFYITKLDDPMLTPEHSGLNPEPPRVSTIAHGFQYLTENRNDEIDGILGILSENLIGLGLPLRSMEDEWGPGQSEFTFDPQIGLAAADSMVLFRNAVKQICRRNGLHATFMTRPGLPNFFSSGWHLHESLREVGSGRNAFSTAEDDTQPISQVGRHFVGGLLEHAAAASVFTTPTVNGYKRFQPNSFAPNKASWALENRGAMLRVIGGPGDPATHLENRIGEPCANPYLYLASQVAAGMAGLERKTDPGDLDENPYEADRTPLPASLVDAVRALEADTLYREAFGAPFVDYMLKMKNYEWGRFLAHVTDWEHREYFEVY